MFVRRSNAICFHVLNQIRSKTQQTDALIKLRNRMSLTNWICGFNRVGRIYHSSSFDFLSLFGLELTVKISSKTWATLLEQKVGKLERVNRERFHINN